jgi:DNA mismatch repair protein MutL
MTEKRQIATIITRYAMAYPQVRFLLEQDGVEIFRSNGSGRLADVVVQALGLDNFKQMIEVDARPNAEGISLYGFTSSPDLNRADRSRITLFVNGRWVQDNSLTFAVTQAYHTLLMNGRFPLSVLMLKLPPQDVDVNVHPTKAEVRFRDANAIFSAVQRGVRRAVIDAAQPPVVRGSYGYGSDEEMEAGEQIDLPMPMSDTGQHARQQRSGSVPPAAYENDPTAIPEGPDAPAKPRTLPMLRVLGQISAAYIVAEGPSGMYLIDQHAAHERVLYEQFMDNYERQGLLTQHTLMGQTISLSAPDARLLEAHQETLHEFGFVLEPFGPNTFAVRSVPAILSDTDPADILTQILTDLESGRLPGQKSIEERIIMRVCKQAAVKAGQILSLDEMNGILRQLERCRSPHTCPHGRPTILHMTTDQLAREFGRMG